MNMTTNFNHEYYKSGELKLLMGKRMDMVLFITLMEK